MTVKNYRFDESLNKYRVYKWFNGKCKHFGAYENESDAQARVSELRENNWNGLYKPEPRVKLPYKEDYDILQKLHLERNVKPKTLETFKQVIRHYTLLHEQSLSELLQLYSYEEENTSWKKSTLKKHLLMYRNYCYTNFMVGTARIYFGKLQTVLRHLEVQLGYLPPLNNKQVNDLAPITYNDLLTKEELELCYNVANPLMKAIILFCSSSGCARRETLNLTIQDYLEANNISVNGNESVKELINGINPTDVPTFKCLRQKTMKYYFTYCTPQANESIMEYLIICRKNLSLNDSLFDCNLYYWNQYFNEINEELGLGKVRKYNKFRSHMLRKYHASTLYNDGMSIDDVDTLQGRGRDSTHQSYFMDNPEMLKKKYVEHMDCLLLEVGE